MAELRPPEKIMTLERLGSLHQCRLSFMRQLTRRMARESWEFSRPVFEIDAQGVGHAVYTAQGPERAYSLVAFAHDLPDHMRSDRVIATAWDTTFTLFDGVPEPHDIERLSQNVPLQEAGRVTEREISVSRANRSVRLWEHVVDCLSNGRQPDANQLEAVGYLMRTTAVYGSGKLGAADREVIANRPEMQSPFQAEMLSVYLTRWFVRDLVEHMAQVRGGDRAARLDEGLARQIGIGNSTGLGMAPYLVNHPVLLNNWIVARETAIARVRDLPASPEQIDLFRDLVNRCEQLVATWRSEHPIQIVKLQHLTDDLAALGSYLEDTGLSGATPWNNLMIWTDQTLSAEGQELVASLILEPHGDLVDDLATTMSDHSGPFVLDGSMPVAEVSNLLRRNFGPLLDRDWTAPENCARAWYISEEKLEPRLGERFEEPIEAYEQPLAPARDATAALAVLVTADPHSPVADTLAHHPEHRQSVRRAQITRSAPYGEIRSNTIGADVVPIDMLRAKLSFFGVTRFDPRSDRWVRVVMYAGAPYPPDLTPDNADLWVYPEPSA